MPTSLKTFLMRGYGVSRTTTGLFDPVLDRNGKPAKLRVIRPKQMKKLIKARRMAGESLANPISADEYRRRFGK